MADAILSEGGSGRACSECGERKGTDCFSKKQWLARAHRCSARVRAHARSRDALKRSELHAFERESERAERAIVQARKKYVTLSNAFKYACVRARVCVCVCVCVCARARARACIRACLCFKTNTDTHECVRACVLALRCVRRCGRVDGRANGRARACGCA